MNPSKTLGEFALDYAQRGWHVLPCNPATKHPYVGCDKDAAGRDIPRTGGLYKATRDPQLITAWWLLWPHAMIGVRMGVASGVWALDPDAPKKPGEPDGRANWAALQSKHGKCPHTHTHLTPGGGRHLLFKYRADRPVTNSEGQIKGLGIDVRGNGGYVIAPPSRRADGKAYEIEDPLDFFNFAEAPDWLYELILTKPVPERPQQSISQRAVAATRRPTRSHAAKSISGILAKMAQEPADSRNRNKLLFWCACRLVEMTDQSILSATDAAGLLIEAGMRSGLSFNEASRTVQSAFRG